MGLPNKGGSKTPPTSKPRQLEVNTGKINKVKNFSNEMQLQSTFVRLLNKYTNQRTVSMSPPKQIYVPNKKEVPAAPMQGIKQEYLIYIWLYGGLGKRDQRADCH
jgi:hypothetical protein